MCSIELAGLDLGEVQDVVEDAQQVLARVLDLLHVVALPGLQLRLQREVATGR
jgi:alpha-D-ribose 1-methylphosphonate 5-triphosphate synthase subunit PhnH